jgi:recombination protein RecA
MTHWTVKLSSIRLEIRRIESIDSKGSEDAVGNRVRVKVVKNKVAPPFKKVELDIMFGKGVSSVASLLDCAVKYDFIEKKGAWYAYGNDKVGQGKENAVEFLDKNPDLAKEIEQKLRDKLFPGQALKAAALAATTGKAKKPAAMTTAAAVPPAPKKAVPDLAGAALDEGIF